MKSRFILCLLAFLALSPRVIRAIDSFSGHEVTPKGAWCWFADPRALHYENPEGTINRTYLGYIDVHGNIKAMQYDFISGRRTEVLIRSYFQPDDHNNPTFLVLPDERVMIFYSRHTDEPCFYYRISREKGNITTLGEEKKIKTSHNTTYPSPFILSEDPQHIYLCWRGIGWHPTIARLTLPDEQDNVQTDWGPYQMIQSTGARPYAKYHSNGKDRILLGYTTGHPDNEMPNFLYFNYINIKEGTLEDVNGRTLSHIAEGPWRVNKGERFRKENPLVVVDHPGNERAWLWQVAETADGKPAIAMVRLNEAKDSHDYYYAQWTGREWKKSFLANAGGHFHQTPNIEKCYSGGMSIDPSNPQTVIASVPVEGTQGKRYEIVKFTVQENGEVSREQLTHNSALNNSRPYVIPGSDRSPLRMGWMYGNYYDWIVSAQRKQGYPTAIYCDYAWPKPTINLEKKRINAKDLTAKSARLKKGDFTISLTVKPDPQNYGGKLFSMGNLSVEIDRKTWKPIVMIGKQQYVSTNMLATADSWQNHPRGTNGDWYEPTPLQEVTYAVTCQGGVLRTYINGMLDQSIPLEKKQLVYGGTYAYSKGELRVYKRALLSEEVEALVSQE